MSRTLDRVFNRLPSMPTVNGDPIVESDSNADGEWTRWAEGTQHCRRSGQPGSGSWTYPVPFVAVPEAFATPEAGSTISRFTVVSSSRTAIACGVWCFQDDGTGSGATSCVKAEGRYK